MFPSEAKQRVPEQFWVVVATTKGDFEVEAIRDWAPIGVDRFFDLVEGMAVLDNLHFGCGDGAPRHALPVQESVLELLTYNPESHSYWFKVGVSEFDWCADYPFSESPLMEKVAADQFVFEGEQQLLEKFKSEKNMDVKMD